jgi:hypothetical protein
MAGGSGGGGAAGATAPGTGPTLSAGAGAADALQAALDACVEYVLVGEAAFNGERARLAAHGARYGELVDTRAAVRAARGALAASVDALTDAQAALDARSAAAAGLLRRMGALRAAGAADDPATLVAAAERYAYSVGGGHSWTAAAVAGGSAGRRLPPAPDEAALRASALFREQGERERACA